MSPDTRFPFASVTVAVAVVVLEPSPTIVVGASASATPVARPAVCLRVALSERDPSVAVIVELPAVLVEVIFAE